MFCDREGIVQPPMLEISWAEASRSGAAAGDSAYPTLDGDRSVAVRQGWVGGRVGTVDGKAGWA